MTKLIRFSPTSDVRHLQREFDRMFDSFFPVNRRDVENADSATWTPRLDLVETEDSYRITLDVPGMAKDDFVIDFHEGVLSVSGERLVESLSEGETLVRNERSFGRFFRSFSIPKMIDEDAIAARYDAGVLSIEVPKAEMSKPRRIAVK